MPLDTSIALQARPFDPVEGYTKALTLRGLASQQKLRDMEIARADSAAADERTLADLYRSNLGHDGGLSRPGLERGMAEKGLGARIPAMRKQWADADDAAAKLGKTKADASKTEAELEHSKAKYVTDMVGRLISRGDVSADLVIDELSRVPPQFAENAAAMARMLPTDPARLRQFLLTVGMEAEKRFTATAPKFEKMDAGNRIITGTVDPMTGQFSGTGQTVKAPEGFVVGQGGRLSADPGYVQAKSQIASAGRLVTNVNVNAVKPLLNEIGTGLGKAAVEGLDAARSANQTIELAGRLSGVLRDKSVIAGPLANQRALVSRVAQTLGVGGASTQEQLANTREVIQGLAEFELQAAIGMRGQGAITDTERQILRRASIGEITDSPQELLRAMQTLEQRARKRIVSHNANVDVLGGIPGSAPIIPLLRVNEPAGRQPAADAAADGMPADIAQIMKKHGGR
jgi:hypothetical protein